jgi:hypothetical protein
MITYKPSARLGLLNEENFTTDPASRGWSVTGSTTFGASGVNLVCTANATTYTLTLEKTNTQLLQYVSFSISGTGAYYFSNTGININTYFNGTLVNTQNIEFRHNTGHLIGCINLFKNTPTDWKISYVCGTIYGSDAGELTSNFSTFSYSDLPVNTLKIVLSGKTAGAADSSRNLYLTNLKWV